MAEEEANRKELSAPSQPDFLEVLCKSCGQIRRFASGTDAGFALYLINSKLDYGAPPALYIEAVKEGEEPINFGPKAALINYGEAWKLQTVIEEVLKSAQKHKIPKQVLSLKKPSEGRYFVKILIAFALMFLLGGALVFFLENLPLLIQLVSSS